MTVYALEQQLLANGWAQSTIPNLRSALTNFGEALLQQQPPISLAGFVEHLSSADPAEQSGAEAQKAAIAYDRSFSKRTTVNLNTALRELGSMQPEHRVLTLEQALNTKLRAPALKTLLPDTDRRLLQAVQEGDGDLKPVPAGMNQIMLIRFGILLLAKGHGGLTGWLEMHNQPEGSRKAKELLERFQNGPELGLSALNKSRLTSAVKRLQACGSVACADSSRPQPVASSSRAAPLAPRFPSDFPPEEASLIESRLRAGLDSGLSRGTLSHYGRELTLLSEWLRNPVRPDQYANPSGLQSLLELAQAGKDAELTELLDASIVGRPKNKLLPAVNLLLAHNVAGQDDVYVPAPAPMAVPQPHLPSPPPFLSASARELSAGSAAVPASPPATSWSPAFEFLGGEEGMQAALRELDEVMGSYRPVVPLSAASSPTFDLDSLYQQLLGDEENQVFLQHVGEVLGRSEPESLPPEAAPLFDAMYGQFADELMPSVHPGTVGPGASNAVLHAMPAEAAVHWFDSRLQDVQMALQMGGQPRQALLRFAQHLAATDGRDGLNSFLQRYESSSPADRSAARMELQNYLAPLGRSAGPGGRTDSLVNGLEALAGIPAASRAWTDPTRRMTAGQVHSKYKSKQSLLPPQDQALLEGVSRTSRWQLTRFAYALLNARAGGLMNWLAMFHLGEGKQARRLMLDHGLANPSIARMGSLPLALDRLQATDNTPSGLRIAVQGTGRTTVGVLARSPAKQARGGTISQWAGTRASDHEAAEVTAVPLEGGNTLMAYALAQRLESEGKAKSTVQNVRVALVALGDALLQQPSVSLAEFLRRLGSADPAQRVDADARRAAIVQPWPNSRRNDANTALRVLSEMPPEQRMWSLDQALNSKMQASAMKTLLSRRDLQILRNLEERSGGVSAATAGKHQVMLIRFGVALMAKGSGLDHWLEMFHDPNGHPWAKEMLDGFVKDNGPTASKKQSFLAAVKRLHEIQLVPETESLRPQLRTPSDRPVSLAPTYPSDFPPTEAHLIETRLAAGQADNLSRRTLENYGRDLVRLSEWLRKPTDPSRPASPSGLESLRELAQAGRSAELQAVRDAFFGRGKPGNAPGAFDLLLGLREGSQRSRPHGGELRGVAHYGTASSTTAEAVAPEKGGSGLRPYTDPDGAPAPLTIARRRDVESRYNVNVGSASGEGLNCLLESVLQLVGSVPRQQENQETTQSIRNRVQEQREFLEDVGVAVQGDLIDIYGDGSPAGILAAQFQVQIQVVELRTRGPRVHPPIGELNHPLVQILHTENHFQPLWPQNQNR